LAKIPFLGVFLMKLFKNNQHGRSMVEMLGVLAIIGVLSVGGIAGYSKAMYKQKMNKSVDIVSKVLMGVNEWSAKNIDDNFDNQNAIKLGILDKSLCNNSNECILPTGGRINVYDDGIEIQFRESNRINLCIDFLSHHWETALPDNSSYISIVSTSGEYVGQGNYIYSTNTNIGVKLEYTLTDIENTCTKACNNVECMIILAISEDV
jgi:type II secretory pathway pseudopilin PulG